MPVGVTPVKQKMHRSAIMFPSVRTPIKVLLGVVAALLVVWALWWVYSTITAKPKAEAKLRGNQVEAAQESGKDAVNTVGAAGEREAASADLDRTNEGDIRNAEGADAAVAAPVRDSGFASLCRRASYREHPKCVQRANPR
jgi:hypothetical protein